MVAQLDADYLELGYGRVARRLASYALFEGRPHTTRGQWFNAVVKCLIKSLAATPGMPSVNRPIFITGLGRSGTTIVGKILSAHRQVGFLNEPKLMWALADPRTDVCADYLAQGGRFRLSAEQAAPGTALFVRRAYARYAALVGARRIVDKYPEFVFRVGYTKSLFPDAIVIFLTRNGRDACSSIAGWGARKVTRRAGETEDWWGRNDKKWRYLWDELVLPDPQYRQIADLGPDKLDAVNRAALEWILSMREGISEEARHPESITRLRYEDLLEDPEGFARQLLTACQLPHDDSVMRYVKRQVGPGETHSEIELVSALRDLFESTMLALGYNVRSRQEQ